jgi:hypothetical protein
MWTIQMEESMIHENNFKESIRMLVVSEPQEIPSELEEKEQETEASTAGKKLSKDKKKGKDDS